MGLSGVVLAGAGLGRRVGARVLWRDLDLEVRQGESVAVTGPSGSGKTALLRALAGLDPLEAGELRLEGRRLEDWAMPAWRARVVYLAQRPAMFEGSVEDNLRRPFALRAHRERPYDPDAAVALLRTLGRDAGFLGQDAAHLSGGEAQIVALVRALLLTAVVLLLDEATASLDPETARHAAALVAGWRADDPRRACVWVSHDAAQRERVATRAVAL
jgi:putative ABC transport system ATP-binding protein